LCPPLLAAYANGATTRVAPTAGHVGGPSILSEWLKRSTSKNVLHFKLASTRQTGAGRKVKTDLSVSPSGNDNGLKALIFMQLAPGWRTGANCDQYPRGDRRLGEACTDHGRAYNQAGKPSVRGPTHDPNLREPSAEPVPVACVNDYVVSGPGALRVEPAFGEALWLTTKLLH
jgi:hypothetical protein